MFEIKLKDSLIGGAVGILFCIGGGILFWSALTAWILSQQSLKWDSISGQVVEFSSHNAGRGSTGFYTIRYKYEFHGKSYEGKKFNFGLSPGYLPMFRAGDTVTVSVNPQQPMMSVLLPGVMSNFTKMFCAIGGVLFLLGAWFITLTAIQIKKLQHKN
jgi:hypothetical protein